MADDYTKLYGERMTPEEFERFKQGLREDIHRIGALQDDHEAKVEISKLFARLNGHSFDD
jgi:hypothetical protein